MPDTDFEDGIYVIANFKNPELVIEAKDGKTVSSQFIASEFQQWELVKMYNIAYAIRNVATRKYLWMELNVPVKDRYELREVEHVFPWHLHRKGAQIQIFVPYTPYLVSLDQSAARMNFLQQDQGQAFGKWHLCKDLHLATSNLLRNGSTYRIVNVASLTVAIDARHRQAGCYAVDGCSDKQKFVAIKTETGWAFRNVETRRFLGLPVCVVPLTGVIRLQTVEHKCTWVVLPHHEDTTKFKLWLPFTFRVMEINSVVPLEDNPIHMSMSGDVAGQWWRFQPVNLDTVIKSQPGEPEDQG